MNWKVLLTSVIMTLYFGNNIYADEDIFEKIKASVRNHWTRVSQIHTTSRTKATSIVIEPHLNGKYDRHSSTELWLYIVSPYCNNSAQILIHTHGNLDIIGEDRFDLTLKTGIPWENIISINIPPNDTSGIKFIAQKENGELLGLTDLYFVTTGDTIQRFYGFPTPEKLYYLESQAKSAKRVNLDTCKNWSGAIPERTPIDSGTLGKSSKRTLTPQEKKKWLERKPLTSKEVEYIIVDDVKYYRKRGETKFREYDVPPVFPGEKPKVDSAKIDSLYSIDIDWTLDLRNPEHKKFVEDMGIEITPREIPGYYKATFSKKVVVKIESEGIGIVYYPEYPPDMSSPNFEDSLRQLNEERRKNLPSRPGRDKRNRSEWETIFEDGRLRRSGVVNS